MKALGLLAVVLLLGACATTDREEDVTATKDFIEVNDLPEAKFIRTLGEVTDEVLNERYVIVTVRDEHFLIEYAHRCDEDPFSSRVKPDVRRDARRIYPLADTFRGCQIRTIYPISADQAQELREIGEAPGED